jgi:predicted NUDIX family phosphoesterase
MGKILCIPQAALPSFPGPFILASQVAWINLDALISSHGVWQDRDSVEADETFKQIIPYITLFSTTGRNDTDIELSSYLRGKAGQEDRLHAKLSFGLGGHIDQTSAENLQDFSNAELLLAAGVRELKEEVGVEVTTEQLKQGYAGLIYTPDDAVGRVHLGVAFALHQEYWRCRAATEIVDFQFRSTQQLFNYRSKLENWSKAFLPFFRDGCYASHMPPIVLWEHLQKTKQRVSGIAAELQNLQPRLDRLKLAFTSRIAGTKPVVNFKHDGKVYQVCNNSQPDINELTVVELKD